MRPRRAQRRRLSQAFVSLTVALLLGAAWWLREDEAARLQPPRATPTAREWVELEAPTLASHSTNDGDSFLIRHRGGEHIFRLYFVDCPEKQRHQLNRPRLADQGAYFGGLPESDVVALGREAREFALTRLTEGRFRIFTRWEPVFDERRHYAHLTLQQPDGTWRTLAELLVSHGLARIHTKGVDLPDGVRRAAFVRHLRQLEKEARLARRGGWATRQDEDE